MSDFNLPPGCRSSDIPGNRPQDVAFEKWLEETLSLISFQLTSQEEEKLADLFDQDYSPQAAAASLGESEN